jgi:hypothetical protein
MRHNTYGQGAVDCSCDIQIRTFANRIEYLDKQTLLWLPLYPDFRLYRDTPELAVLLAADGKNLTFEAGCSVSINGFVYTDFNLAYEALQFMISAPFGSFAMPYGTTLQRPISPVIGQMYLDLTLGYPIVWRGDAWINDDGAIV